MRADDVERESMDGEFDEAEGGFDDLAVGGGEEDEDSREDFGVHGWGDCVWWVRC